MQILEMSIEMSRKKREKGTRAETRKRVQYLFRSEIDRVGFKNETTAYACVCASAWPGVGQNEI